MDYKKNSQFTSISIPSSLYRAIEERLEGTEFTSVEAYVVFVLSEVVNDDDEEQLFNEEDEAEVKKRLSDLGYLD